MITECAGCSARWTGTKLAHCTACHRTLTPEALARHRGARRGYTKLVCFSDRELVEAGLTPDAHWATDETIWRPRRKPLGAPGAPDGPQHPNGATRAPECRSGPPRGTGGIS